MSEQQLNFFPHNGRKNERPLRRRQIIKIPLDTVILLSIINLFIIVISFSLGMEEGKKKTIVITKSPREIVKEYSDDSKTLKTDAATPEIASPEKTPQEKQNETPGENGTYIVQVASYFKETSAEAEKRNLEKEGFPAGIAQSGKYVILFVGKFNTKEEAERNKSILRKKYRDCFIKQLL